MVDDVHRAVREACLWLPEAEEYLSHGSPNFRVRGRGFASYVINHHGDGRVALWLAAPSGAQEHFDAADSRRFFIPPYVGTRGWLGVQLDKGLAWRVIAGLVRDAYLKVAPMLLQSQVGTPPRIAAPTRSLRPGTVDPMLSPRGKALLKIVRSICLPLPESREVSQFGAPVWQAGKKTFFWLRCADRRFAVYFWVGVDQQNLFLADPRFHVPAYMGHNGWMALDVTDGCDTREVAELALRSYRRLALKRMLQCLSPG